MALIKYFAHHKVGVILRLYLSNIHALTIADSIT